MAAARPAPTAPSRLLFLFADGGALQDLNDRLRAEEAPGSDSKRVDFLQIPDRAIDALKASDDVKEVVAPLEARIFFNLGSTTGASFQEKMASAWSVETLPLGMCRYERTTPADALARSLSESGFMPVSPTISASLPHACQNGRLLWALSPMTLNWFLSSPTQNDVRSTSAWSGLLLHFQKKLAISPHATMSRY